MGRGIQLRLPLSSTTLYNSANIRTVGRTLYPEAIYQQLRSHAESGLLLLREMLPAMAPVAQYAGWTKAEQLTLGHLLGATARASESALLLIAYAQVWDAEIVLRSVTEGSLKFCYLLQDQARFQERHREYADDLFQVARYKDHKKAGDLLAALPDASSPEWKPIRDLILPNEEVRKIEEAYPSARRRELETRWGFTGLITTPGKSEDTIYEGFKGFAHGYSNASHLIHMDCIGVVLPIDRDLRTPPQRDAGSLVHGAKVILNTVSLFLVRLRVGYQFVGGPNEKLMEVARKVDGFCARFDDTFRTWLDLEYPKFPEASG